MEGRIGSGFDDFPSPVTPRDAIQAAKPGTMTR